MTEFPESQPEPQPEPIPGVDDLLDSLLLGIVERQETYFAKHGKYWQGIRTHAITPADGIEVAPNLTVKPTDQAENWDSVGITLPAEIPMALTINVYDGPQGQGYEVVAEVEVKDRLYRRIEQHGPEMHRAHGWREVISDD